MAKGLDSVSSTERGADDWMPYQVQHDIGGSWDVMALGLDSVSSTERSCGVSKIVFLYSVKR